MLLCLLKAWIPSFSVLCFPTRETHITSDNLCVRGHTYHGETHITVTPVILMEHGLLTLGDACGGDSGGPLAIKNNQRWVLAGVISWGDPFGCGIIGKYSVYTRISVFARWINAHINGDDLNQRGS